MRSNLSIEADDGDFEGFEILGHVVQDGPVQGQDTENGDAKNEDYVEVRLCVVHCSRLWNVLVRSQCKMTHLRVFANEGSQKPTGFIDPSWAFSSASLSPFSFFCF